MTQKQFVAKMKTKGLIPASYPRKTVTPKFPTTQDTIDLIWMLSEQGMRGVEIAKGMYLSQSFVSRVLCNKRYGHQRG